MSNLPPIVVDVHGQAWIVAPGVAEPLDLSPEEIAALVATQSQPSKEKQHNGRRDK